MKVRRGINVLLATTLLVFSIASCAGGEAPAAEEVADRSGKPEKIDMDRKIQIVAKLESFRNPYLVDHMKDGTSRSVVASVFIITEPTKHAGKQISVSHADIPDRDSYWRVPGSVVEMEIAEELLEFVAEKGGYIPAGMIVIANTE